MNTKFTSRVEFQTILKKVVNSLRDSLDRPGLTPLTPEQIHFWLREITLDDIRAVSARAEIEGWKEAA